MVADIVTDGAFQFSDRTKRAASNAFAGDLGKPSFYLIEPGSTRRGEVHLVARVIGEPLLSRPNACALRSCRGLGARPNRNRFLRLPCPSGGIPGADAGVGSVL